MPSLSLDTDAAVIARTLKAVEQHSPVSRAHRTRREAATEEPEDPCMSSRSSYYVSSPDRETFQVDLDDTKSTVSSKRSRRSFSFLRKLRPSKKSPTAERRDAATGKTDRLKRFVSFKGFYGGPEYSLEGSYARAAEAAMFGQRSAIHGSYWPVL